MTRLFQARPQATVNIDVSAATQRVSLGKQWCGQVAVLNDGTATVWVNFGDVTVVATLANSAPVRSGDTRGFSIPPGIVSEPYMAAIAAGATGKIYGTPGEGV